MYLTYLHYCHPTSPFYDQRNTDDTDALFGFHLDPVVPGWSRVIRPEWVMYQRDDAPPRWQGWKIHVSATLANAEKLLDVVAAYCFGERVPFKALAGMHTLIRRNSKYADRGGSGKFITIYPQSDEVLTRTLHRLDELVGGQPGPTILSDLRFNDGPLYVRYGAFVSRQVSDESGHRVECFEDPDGNLVPDERRPGFHPPAWAPIPPVLEQSMAARNDRVLAEFPYLVTKALHFSNGGGVYLAERRDTPGRRVLLKEARPHCGLDESGADAIARLEQERDALEGLAGIPGIPIMDGYVDGVEHKFLARSYIEGRSLMDLSAEHNPLVNPESGMGPAEYVSWADGILRQITDIVTRMHARGWVFGDLHPGNVIVDDAGRAHFIDFESASRDIAGHRQVMGVFGFRAPTGYRGTAVDLFALGCIRIGLLLPLTRLLSLGPAHSTHLRLAAEERFGLSAGFFGTVDSQLGWEAGVPPERTGDGDETGAFVSCLRRWRSPERDDRLFPGDVRQFLEPAGGLGLGYGAAGVLWTLHEAGAAVDHEDLAWLRDHVHAAVDIPVGFWNGLAGIAFAMEGIDAELAESCTSLAVRGCTDVRDLSMGSGLSGLGTYLLRDSRHLETVASIAERIAHVEAYPAAGLVNGAAGLAVFALRAGLALNNAKYIDVATRLLELEVARFGVEHGETPVAAALPAFGTGIGTGVLGLAFALHDHVRLAGSEQFAGPLRRIIRLTQRTLAIHNGLLAGRAGQIQLLLAVAPDEQPTAEAIRRCLGEMDWYVTRLDSHAVSLGDESLKASLDLGTGLAGVLATRRAARLGTCTFPLWDRPL